LHARMVTRLCTRRTQCQRCGPRRPTTARLARLRQWTPTPPRPGPAHGGPTRLHPMAMQVRSFFMYLARVQQRCHACLLGRAGTPSSLLPIPRDRAVRARRPAHRWPAHAQARAAAAGTRRRRRRPQASPSQRPRRRSRSASARSTRSRCGRALAHPARTLALITACRSGSGRATEALPAGPGIASTLPFPRQGHAYAVGMH